MILTMAALMIGAGFEEAQAQTKASALVSATVLPSTSMSIEHGTNTVSFSNSTISMKLVGSANVLVSVDSRNEKRTSVVQLSYIKSTSIILPAGNSSRTTSLTYLSS